MQEKSLIPGYAGKSFNFTFFTKNDKKIFLKKGDFIYG